MKKKIVKVTAIVLLIGLLFSMASLVSAGFVEEILNKELEISRGSSSYKQCNKMEIYKLNNVNVYIFVSNYKNHIPIKILGFHLI